MPALDVLQLASRIGTTWHSFHDHGWSATGFQQEILYRTHLIKRNQKLITRISLFHLLDSIFINIYAESLIFELHELVSRKFKKNIST